MKTNKLFILTGLAAIASTSCSQKENTSGQPAKPMNILYIMTDDHSFQTISSNVRNSNLVWALARVSLSLRMVISSRTTT